MDHNDHDRKTKGDCLRVLWTGAIEGRETRFVAVDEKGTVRYSAHRYCRTCEVWHADADVSAAPLITALIAAGKLKL